MRAIRERMALYDGLSPEVRAMISEEGERAMQLLWSAGFHTSLEMDTRLRLVIAHRKAKGPDG